MQGADKALELRAADDIVGRVALGLNIDPGETEGVLVDDSIDATVATAADPACVSLTLGAGAVLVDDSLLPDVPWRPELDEALPLVS